MRFVFCMAALSAVASSAPAAMLRWDWHQSEPGPASINNSGGTFQSISATFDEATHRLRWSMTFSDQVTHGATLALNNGPTPNGRTGELCLLYIDANNPDNVILTAYGYNGRNPFNSYADGNPYAPSNQPPDIIKNALQRESWVIGAGVVDSGGTRTIWFDIDATDLINHTPRYPDPIDPYYGIGFGDSIGVWLDTFRTFDVSYTQSGRIQHISRSGAGWFNAANLATVPAPSAAVLGVLMGFGVLRRRR